MSRVKWLLTYHVPIPKKMQAVPIPSKQEQSKPNHIQIDSGLLFQRILSTCSNSPQDLSKAFSYELAPTL